MTSQLHRTAVCGQTRRDELQVVSGAEVEEVPVIGIRRVIAQRMTQTVQTIPHFSYVEEVDVTELEVVAPASEFEAAARGRRRTLTCRSLHWRWLACCREFPQCNVRYDAERNVLQRYRHCTSASQPRRRMV